MSLLKYSLWFFPFKDNFTEFGKDNIKNKKNSVKYKYILNIYWLQGFHVLSVPNNDMYLNVDGG